MEITRRIATGILTKRTALTTVSETENVVLNNVSFFKKDGVTPHQDPKWDEGNPYAIVNINAMNAYDAKRAQALFLAGDYEGATNLNLSARVSVKDGKALANCHFVKVVTEERTFIPKDETEEVTAIAIKSVKPMQADIASEKKFVFDFGAEPSEEDETGMPKADRKAADATK